MQTLDQYLAERIREIKEGRQWRQHDLAASARSFGFAWKSDTVAALEGGTRKLAVGEFSYLTLILQVDSWTEIFSTDDTILIAPDLAVKARDYGRFLASKTRRPAPQFNVDRVQRKLAAKAESELKAARRLAVTPEKLTAAAWKLWHRSLTHERERLFTEATKDKDVSPRESQALRGHITRQLISQLKEELKPDMTTTTRRTNK